MSKDQDAETDSPKLSKKEYAKKIRRDAYRRAKEFKKTDPRELARKEQAKIQRKAAYQKAKEKSKAAKVEKKEKLMLQDQVILASELDDRPLAPVISLDSARNKRRTQPQQPRRL